MKKSLLYNQLGFYKKLLLLLPALLLSISLSLPAQTTHEYSLKGQFLYNFLQFVGWPDTAFHAPDAPFIIGILGEDPFHTSIDETVAGAKVKGRPVIIQRFPTVIDVVNCNILFVSKSETLRIPEILTALQNRSILTVGDIPDFATMGGMIQLNNVKSKIKLKINLAATKPASLTISSKLLRVAEVLR